jgi:transposase
MVRTGRQLPRGFSSPEKRRFSGSDLFGKKGRLWLGGLELAPEERESVDAALRQVDFLDSEIEAVESLIAKAALESAEVRRLMTVPGVNVVAAATFMAAIGDIRRFESPRKLVAYAALASAAPARAAQSPSVNV